MPTSLVIAYQPQFYVQGNLQQARYVAVGLEDRAISIDDPVLPLSQLQTLVTNMAAAIESQFPGVYVADLSTRKRIVADKIDRRTQELLDAGFTTPAGSPTNGMVMSLSALAQMRYLQISSNLLSILTATVIESQDHLSSVNYPWLNLGAAQALCKSALTYAHGLLNAGAVLKDQVRACTTEAQLAAITDTR